MLNHSSVFAAPPNASLSEKGSLRSWAGVLICTRYVAGNSPAGSTTPDSGSNVMDLILSKLPCLMFLQRLWETRLLSYSRFRNICVLESHDYMLIFINVFYRSSIHLRLQARTWEWYLRFRASMSIARYPVCLHCRRHSSFSCPHKLLNKGFLIGSKYPWVWPFCKSSLPRRCFNRMYKGV